MPRLGVCLQHNALYENVTVEERPFSFENTQKTLPAKLLAKHNSNLEFQLSFSSMFVTFFFRIDIYTCFWWFHVFYGFATFVLHAHLKKSEEAMSLLNANLLDFQFLRKLKAERYGIGGFLRCFAGSRDMNWSQTCSGLKTAEYTESTCYFQKRWHMKS